jgi:acetylornithine deacetylase/succinyl-diaminopimelate desuccinylase-like protein
MKHSSLFFLAVILAYSLSSAQIPIEDELFSFVQGIEGKTNQGRNEFIKSQLRTLGIGYVTASFTHTTIKKKDTTIIKGENIIVRTGAGTGTKQIVVGAHYDVFNDSPGANDNGSGVAVLLTLIKQLQDMEWNYSVDFCFFDQEETGFLGSYYYAKKFVIPRRYFAMVNLDIEGTGDEVYLGPVGSNSQKIMRFVHEAVKHTGFHVVESADYPASDHVSFAKLNLQNIAISIVPKGDGERLSTYVRNGYKADSLDTPQILGIMHTFEDRSRLISPASLKMSYEFTKSLLMQINESGR